MISIRSISWIVLLLILVPAGVRGAGQTRSSWVITYGQEERILSLVAPNRTLAPVLPGTWFDRIEITDDAIVFVVSGRDPPADPVSIRLTWDSSAPKSVEPPPWHLEIQGTPGSDAQEESVALLRSRIEVRLTAEVYQSLLVFMANSWEDPRDCPFHWVDRVVQDLGLIWRERSSRGVIQHSWQDVGISAPARPQWGLLLLLAIAIAVFASFRTSTPARRALRRFHPERPRTWWPWMAGVGGVLLAAGVWWLHAPMSEAGDIISDLPASTLAWLVPARRGFALAQVLLYFAVGFSALGLVDLIRRSRAPVPGRLLGGTALVAVVSGLVRIGMTSPNLFSRGVGGFERLLRYAPGEGGTSVLIAWLLPVGEQGFIWPAVHVVAWISALGPPLLVLLGRALGLSTRASIIAGLALACWPVHAMVSASDLLIGPMLTTGIAAWSFGAFAVRRRHPVLLLPAAGLLAWGIWCRLDGFLLVLPLAGIVAPAVRGWLRRPELWGAGLCLGLAMACRLIAGSPGIPGGGWHAGEQVSALLTFGHAIFPWWILAVVPGVLLMVRRSRLRWPSALGLVLSLLSALILYPRIGPIAWVEGGGLFLPWAALICGAGLAEVSTRLPTPAMYRGFIGLILLGMLLVPWLHGSQLERPHEPALLDRAFRAALEQVEPGCGIRVPAGDAEDEAADNLEWYRLIAWEEFERNPDRPRGDRVVQGNGQVDGTACWHQFTGAVEVWKR